MADEPTLTLKEVAERLRLNIETARRLVASGRIRGYKPGGSKSGWRVRKSELDRFVADREASAVPAGTE
jgi:excisionase family DNA binding protein